MHGDNVRAMALELLGEAAGRDAFLSAAGEYSKNFYNPLDKFIGKAKLKPVHSDAYEDSYERKTDKGAVTLVITKGLDRGIIKRGSSPMPVKRSLSREDNALPLSVEIRSDVGGKTRRTVGPKINLSKIGLDNPKERKIYHKFLRRALAWIRQNVMGALGQIGIQEAVATIVEGSQEGAWDSVYVELAFLSRVDNALSDSGFVRDSERYWYHPKSNVSVEVVEDYYPELDEVCFDKVVFGGDFGVKTVPYPLLSGPFTVKGYMEHLSVVFEGILAHAIALMRGMEKSLGTFGESQARQAQISVDKAAKSMEKMYKGASIVGMAVKDGAEVWMTVRRKRVTPAIFEADARKATGLRWEFKGREYGGMRFVADFVAKESMTEEKIPPVDVFVRKMQQNDHLAQHGVSASEIAFSFKTSQKKAIEYLEKLVKAGHMKKEKAGRTVVYKRAKMTGHESDHKPGSVRVPRKEKGLQKGKLAAHKRMKKMGLRGNTKPKKVDAPGSFWHGAEIISQYSRADALRDGQLVDVTKYAKEAGFKYPTAFTGALWKTVERISKKSYEDLPGRMHDIFMMMKFAIRGGARGRGAKFTVKFAGRNHHLMAEVGPGDTPEPVITVGYPQDF